MNRRRAYFLALGAAGLALSCAGGAMAQTGGFAITLTGQETPALQPWTKPASISWVESSDEGEDRFNVEAALKATRLIYDLDVVDGQPDTDISVFGRVVAAVNDQEAINKRKSTYKAQFGLQFDWYSGGPVVAGTSDENGRNGLVLHDWTIYTDVYLSYDQARTFGTPASAACVANPALAACGDQDQTSHRFVVDVLPQHIAWSGGAYAQNKAADADVVGFSWNVSPKISLFHDRITQAVLNDAGQEIDGGVTGARVTLGGAVTPSYFEHRLVFRAAYQHTWAFDRSAAREPVFGASTGLFTASVDYEFGPRFWEAKGQWAPSIGLSYTSGEDPLEGRKDRDDKSLMLRLTFAN